jgi:hypothetical protein
MQLRVNTRENYRMYVGTNWVHGGNDEIIAISEIYSVPPCLFCIGRPYHRLLLQLVKFRQKATCLRWTSQWSFWCPFSHTPSINLIYAMWSNLRSWFRVVELPNSLLYSEITPQSTLCRQYTHYWGRPIRGCTSTRRRSDGTKRPSRPSRDTCRRISRMGACWPGT